MPELAPAFALNPTPVDACRLPGGDVLWVKRDDLSHPLYGGNKPRKLQGILTHALARGATRVLTFGAAGSHHVLATTLFGRLLGLEVAALLLPQARTHHAVDVLRASIARGALLYPVASPIELPLVLARAHRRGDLVIAVGGSTPRGTRAFIDAAGGLARAVRAGEAPEPAEIVVAAGSGGTAAGLALGVVMHGLRSRVRAVSVAGGRLLTAPVVRAIAVAAAGSPSLAARAQARLDIDASQLGEGYGRRTREGAHAADVARSLGLTLDPTYTEKAFACALSRVPNCTGPVLFWHTLSSAPEAPLLEGAPDEAHLDPRLAALLR